MAAKTAFSHIPEGFFCRYCRGKQVQGNVTTAQHPDFYSGMMARPDLPADCCFDCAMEWLHGWGDRRQRAMRPYRPQLTADTLAAYLLAGHNQREAAQHFRVGLPDVRAMARRIAAVLYGA